MKTPTKPSDAERERRWNAIGDLMREADVGAVVGNGDLGDENANQRYLSAFRSVFDDIAPILFEDGESAMVISNPGVLMFAKQLSWMDNIFVGAETKPWLIGDTVDTPVVASATVGAEVADQLRQRGVDRVGLADGAHFPAAWRDAIALAIPDCTFVDLGPGIDRLRLVKSAEEIDNIRTSCQISDDIWAEMSDIIKVGRRECEVMADFEYRLRSAGAEASYNMFFQLPMFATPHESMPSTKVIEAGSTYLVEVSPRFAGYYGQQTGLVTLGTMDPAARDALEAINRARAAGVELMKPGNDITEVAAAVDKQLAAEGYKLASPLIGHFVGLQLEEPRAGAKPLTLEAGMVFICHPFAEGWPAYMRADTFLITEDGAERLTTRPLDPLEI